MSGVGVGVGVGAFGQPPSSFRNCKRRQSYCETKTGWDRFETEPKHQGNKRNTPMSRTESMLLNSFSILRTVLYDRYIPM